MKNWRKKCLGLGVHKELEDRDQQNQDINLQGSVCVTAISVPTLELSGNVLVKDGGYMPD